MAIWRSLDAGWGVAVVRVTMVLIFLTAAWSKVASGFGTVAANLAKMGMAVPGVARPFIALLELAGGVLLVFAGSGRLAVDEVWLEPRRA